MVVGLTDAEWGQRVAAAVKIKPGAALSPEEIMRFARQEIAAYKIPRQIRFVKAFPRTASGKIQRQAVRKGFDESDERAWQP